MPQDLAILLDPEHAFPAAPGPFSDDDDVLDALVLLGMKQAGEIASSSRPRFPPTNVSVDDLSNLALALFKTLPKPAECVEGALGGFESET
jgi:hypothetical protein